MNQQQIKNYLMLITKLNETLTIERTHNIQKNYTQYI